MPPIGRGRSLRLIFAILALILMAVAIGWVLQDRRAAAATPSPTPQSIAQQATATPGSVILPTSTSTAPPATPTETRTPTPAGPVYVEARNPDTNVRSGPDISNDRLGQIQPGERYPVLGRRFRWLQIEYPNTPSRVGWVFEDVVNIIGDETLIREIDPQQLPTNDPTLAAEQETLLAITQTPGGVLTITAQAFVTPQGLFTVTPDSAPQRTLAPGERLPTFTFPPFTNTPIPIAELQAPPSDSSSQDSALAPAIPVLGLFALGMLGLLISVFRRL